jgi:hypothetical protein
MHGVTIERVGHYRRVLIETGACLLTAGEAEELAGAMRDEAWATGVSDGFGGLVAKPFKVQDNRPCVVVKSDGRMCGAVELEAFAAGLERAAKAAREIEVPGSKFNGRRNKKPKLVEVAA